MNTDERYIATADLGTSKLALSVSRITGRSISVIYYKEFPAQGVRNSFVLNVRKVGLQLKSALDEAEKELNIKILQMVVGLPRYYVQQETASAKMERSNPDSQIDESEVSNLKSMALESYPLANPGKEVIYGAVAQSFSTEDCANELESDIAGMTSTTLEGNFKVFVGDRRSSSNIDQVFNDYLGGVAISRKYFTAVTTAKAVLKEEQMENGVALIELGAGVSSVSIFKGKIMRFYAAIPFGGNTITNDIQSECNISFDLAENIKKGYGACMPDRLSSFGEKSIRVTDRSGANMIQVPVKYISEIITARMKEIIEALLYHIQASGYSSEDYLRAGVMVTGGGAEMVNCANYIKELSGYSVKVARPRKFFSCQECEEATSPSAAASMGMILAAQSDRLLNCLNEPPVRKEDRPEETENAGETSEAAENTAEANVEAEQFKPIEDSISEGLNDGPTVFDEPTEDEIKEHEQRKKERKKSKKDNGRITWTKRLIDKVKGSLESGIGNLYDNMGEDV